MTTTTLAQLVEDAFDARAEGLHVATLGRVERYDAAARRADVKPLVRRLRVTEDGDQVADSVPVVPDVPVVFPGTGGYVMEYPLERGDFVLLVHLDRASGGFFTGRGEEADPDDNRTHALTDAVAFTGLFPGLASRPAAPSGALTLGSATGARVWVRPGEVALGSESPAAKVATDSAVEAALNTLKSAITTAAVVPGDGGAAFKANLIAALSAWPSPVGSSKVRVDP